MPRLVIDYAWTQYTLLIGFKIFKSRIICGNAELQQILL